MLTMNNNKKKPTKKRKTLTIPLQQSDIEHNVLMESIGTKESKKLVKKRKKINVEDIFIKSKNKKK